MPPDKKKKRKCAWTVFYNIGNEHRVFRAIVQTTSAENAVNVVEDMEGAVNHAVVYKGRFAEPAFATF